MSGCNSKLADPMFINWIKARIASNTVKECIEVIVDKEINIFLRDVLNAIATKQQIENDDLCYECTLENVLPCRTNNFCEVRQGRCFSHNSKEKNFQPCPKNICNRIQEKIRQSHRFNKPSWRNTDAQEWCKNPWEIAKCFMPPDGYFDKTSVGETDLNGILSVMLNHSGFKNIIDKDICIKVREYGNDIRHSANLHVSSKSLKVYLNTLVEFLKSSSTLQNDAKAKQAVQAIQKIQNEELSISNGDITKVLEKSVEEETKRSTAEIAKETKTRIQALKEALEEVKNEIRIAEQTTIGNINAAASTIISAGIDKIESSKLDALAQIEASKKQTTGQSELSYEQRMDMLKNDLLDFNFQKHSAIPITPVFEETDVLITEFYVRPELISIERQSFGLLGSEIRTPLADLNKMFYKEKKRNNEIYLTSDAGFGKTSFSKFLVITWCYAHSDELTSQYFCDKDLHLMREFDLVFLIQLRDVSIECDVDDMIIEHIIKQLSRPSHIDLPFLQNVLHQENCLIILDGLDEWLHPSGSSCHAKLNSIPHRKVRRKCTVLTTTRPWKLGIINIKASQIDKRVELCGLSEANIGRLKDMAISKLLGDYVDRKAATGNFNAEIKDKELANLESNPTLLMYIICLWCEGKPLGKSKSELYSQIVELLLNRAEQKSKLKSVRDMETENLALNANDQDEIPWCLKGHDLCLQYYQLFKALGHLAFDSLFDKSRSNTLVFDKTKADGFLSKECLRVSLDSGMLTETENLGSLLVKKCKISFCHKTVQEYLAALYMQATKEGDDIVKKTLNICKSIDSLLEMSSVFVFLSGLNYKTFECLSDKLAIIVNKDESIQKYRHGCISSTSNYSFVVKPLKDIQNMYINCMKEIQMQNHEKLRLCLQDIFIDEDFSKEAYRSNLMKLKVMNEGSVKSISIRTEGITNLGEIIETFQLSKDTSLDKINFRGECSSNDIQSLLSGAADNLKCVEVLSSEWLGNTFALKYVPWTDAISNTFQRMHQLEALHLYAFVMNHAQLNEMMTYIVQRTKMKDIALLNLKCRDHNSACSGYQLDLSRHESLRLLSLDNLPISHLSVNVSVLEESVVGRLSSSSVLSSFLTALETATRVRRFTCRNFNSTNQIDEMVNIMGEMSHLRYVGILYIDFGEREHLLSSKMSNIELVRLVEATMKCCLLRNLVKIIKTFKQSVTIVLFNCNVTTEDEYEIVKKEIKADELILVLFDGVLKSQSKQYSFKSIPNDQP
ncbi:uncharacterized protein LOC123563570 [Mercenaria mercenaria]|uniref:uncharacterized protein LOC123563570 n=1 Tax=Mercenaria mercenaria TaxID=6596 RepID=UPI00234ED67C|nr:uncharacterized protein LOC123563570 [Mercenaria mercenaria]